MKSLIVFFCFASFRLQSNSESKTWVIPIVFGKVNLTAIINLIKGHLAFSSRVYHLSMEKFTPIDITDAEQCLKIEGILIVKKSYLSQQNSLSQPKGVRLADYANTSFFNH